VKNYYRYRVIDGDAQELKTGHAARVAWHPPPWSYSI
jgi:hypothetical protein